MPKQSRSRPNPALQLSVQALKSPKSHPPASNAVKIRPKSIPIHFKWALILTVTCFFVIGPCWVLYRTMELRRLIAQADFDRAHRLSSKMSVILMISTIIGVFIWVSILFCSVGLLLTGFLLNKNYI